MTLREFTLEDFAVMSIEDRVTIARNCRMLYRSQRNAWNALNQESSDPVVQSGALANAQECQAVMDAIDATRDQFADS